MKVRFENKNICKRLLCIYLIIIICCSTSVCLKKTERNEKNLKLEKIINNMHRYENNQVAKKGI